jgi:hypothetical protein
MAGYISKCHHFGKTTLEGSAPGDAGPAHTKTLIQDGVWQGDIWA